jgi:hypothetical protein
MDNNQVKKKPQERTSQPQQTENISGQVQVSKKAKLVTEWHTLSQSSSHQQ